MKIDFIEENGTTFALSQNCVYDNHHCTELLWAEIDCIGGVYTVRFESDYGNPVYKNTVAEAKKYVLENYFRYKPTQNGPKYPIDEE